MPVVIDPPIYPAPPSPVDDGSNLWELLYEAMGFHRDDDVSGDLQRLCESLCAPYQPIYDLVRERADGTPAFGTLLDPDECPVRYLPYLAKWVGAVLTPGMSEEQQRQEIAAPTGWARGRLPSIELITKRELTGTKWVRIRPRTPGPGRIYIRTLLSETPNPDRVAAELLEHGIPAWELLSYAAIEGVTVEDVAAGWKTVEELAGAFATVDEVTHLLPEDLPE